MANYAANARTNFFRVKNVDSLKADLNRFGIEAASWGDSRNGAEFVIQEDSNNERHGAIALFSYDSWPALDEDSVAMRLDLQIEDEAPDVPEEYESFHDLVAAHLVDGEVAILMEVGFEKMRYLGATAVALNAAGESRRVDLEDIYTLAQELTTESYPVSRAEY